MGGEPVAVLIPLPPFSSPALSGFSMFLVPALRHGIEVHVR